jgi:hypothetical protein
MKIYKHFLRDFELEKNKKWFQAQKFKMADEFKMAVKTFFFSIQNFKNDKFSKKFFCCVF